MKNYVFALIAAWSITAFAQGSEEPPLTDDALTDDAEPALTWICQYARQNPQAPLVLWCHGNDGRQVLIPIWNYDYGDGMVDRLMQAALCRGTITCRTWLHRRKWAPEGMASAGGQ